MEAAAGTSPHSRRESRCTDIVAPPAGAARAAAPRGRNVTWADVRRLDAMLAAATRKPDEAGDEKQADTWAFVVERARLRSFRVD